MTGYVIDRYKLFADGSLRDSEKTPPLFKEVIQISIASINTNFYH